MTDLERGHYLRELRRIMDQSFDLEGIKVLCFDLQIDYEHLAGENSNKLIKIQSLIFYLGRRERLHELSQLLIEHRPQIELPEIPDDNKRIRQDIEYLEPKNRPDSALFAGLVTINLLVIGGYCFALFGRFIGGNTSGTEFLAYCIYPYCTPIWIFGLVRSISYKSRRAFILSIILFSITILPGLFRLLYVIIGSTILAIKEGVY